MLFFSFVGEDRASPTRMLLELAAAAGHRDNAGDFDQPTMMMVCNINTGTPCMLTFLLVGEDLASPKLMSLELVAREGRTKNSGDLISLSLHVYVYV